MLKPFFIKKKNIDNRLAPVVSAADAGKVLGVTEDGKIAAVEAGGGGESDLFYVNFTILQDESMVCDKTLEEINTALNNNKLIVARSDFYGSVLDHSIGYPDGNGGISFDRTIVRIGDRRLVYVYIFYFNDGEGNIIDYNNKSYPLASN